MRFSGKVILGPGISMDGFLYVLKDPWPDKWGGRGLGMEDVSVSFFLELPHYKSWQELPNPVQEWAFENLIAPVPNSAYDVCHVSFSFPHD